MLIYRDDHFIHDTHFKNCSKIDKMRFIIIIRLFGTMRLFSLYSILTRRCRNVHFGSRWDPRAGPCSAPGGGWRTPCAAGPGRTRRAGSSRRYARTPLVPNIVQYIYITLLHTLNNNKKKTTIYILLKKFFLSVCLCICDLNNFQLLNY